MRRLFNKRIGLPILLSIAAILLVLPLSAHALSLFDIPGTGTIIDGLSGILSAVFEVFILPLAAALMYLAGNLMDMAINFGLHTAYIFSLSPAINLGWVIIRDLANIFFIFIMIYISLGTIVNSTSFGTKRLLTQLIIAALLINFSLFITKAVIDVSNIFGNWLYGGIQKTLVVNSSSTDPSKTTSLGGLIAQRLGIISFWQSNATENKSAGGTPFSDPSKGFVGVILRLAVVLIATYIFMYCAVLFISRSITILFLLVFSPIGFMGGVLPQIKKYSSEWRDELVSAAIFPVAFLLMLYISLQFINSLKVLGLSSLQDKSVDILGGISVSQYFQYFLIIFLLHASLKVAKDNSGEMGKAVGGMADGLGKLAVNAVGTYATGGLTTGLRALGRGAGAAMSADSGGRMDAFRKTARENVPTWVTSGKMAAKMSAYIKDPSKAAKDVGAGALNKMKSGTWDIRNIPTGQGSVGDILTNTVGDATGSKIELKGKDAKTIKTEQSEWAEERKIETANNIVLKQIEATLSAKSAFAAGGITATQRDAQIKAARGTMADASSKLSNKQLEKMDKAALKNEDFIQSISQNQVEHLGDKMEASDIDKAAVWQKRLKPLSVAATTGLPAQVKDKIKSFSDKEIENLDFADLHASGNLPTLVDPSAMGYDKFNALMKSSKLTGSTKELMRDARYQSLKATVAGTAPAAAVVTELSKFKDAHEISKLEKTILTDRRVAENLTTDVLNKMVSNDIDQATRDSIRRTIERHPGGVPNIDRMKGWLAGDRGDLF